MSDNPNETFSLQEGKKGDIERISPLYDPVCRHALRKTEEMTVSPFPSAEKQAEEQPGRTRIGSVFTTESLKSSPLEKEPGPFFYDQQIVEQMMEEEQNLLPLLLNPDSRIRTGALRTAEILYVSVRLQILSDLQKAFDHSLFVVRMAAVEGISFLGEKDAHTFLMRALDDDEWQVRATAVRELGKAGLHTPLPPLIKALHDDDISVRDAAVWALKSLAKVTWEETGGRQPMEALAMAAEDDSEVVRAAVAEALGEFCEAGPVRPLLLRLTEDESELVRSAALEALGKLREYMPVREIVKALREDESALVRMTAGRNLERCTEGLSYGKLCI